MKEQYSLLEYRTLLLDVSSLKTGKQIQQLLCIILLYNHGIAVLLLFYMNRNLVFVVKPAPQF